MAAQGGVLAECRANIDYIHVYMGTRRREIVAHRHTQSLRQI